MPNILIAEDDVVIGRILHMVLSKSGYTVELVTDGHQAFQRASVRSAELDLLISDLSMPDWDGLETIGSLGLVCPDLKIIVVSAYLREEKYRKPLVEASNVVGFLAKPFKNSDLLEMVKEHLG